MKFFNSLISSYHFEHSVYLDDVQDIPEPSHLLCCLYSKPHIQLPRNVDPNTVSLTKETLTGEVVMSFPSISLLNHLRLRMEDIQYACEHDPYLQLLLVSEHSQHYKFVQLNPYSVSVHPLLIHDNDTS